MCMKKFDKFMASKLKKIDWLDIGYVKLSVLFLAFMIAKLWPAVLGLDWYWYLIIGIVFMARPLYRAYIK